MFNTACIAGWVLALIAIVSCSESGVTVQQGVSLELAQTRAAILDNVHYRLRFDIPEDPQGVIEAQVEISFDLARGAGDLQLDFREDVASVLAVRSNDQPVDFRFESEHIIVPAKALRTGRNRLLIDFVAGSDSLNRNPGYVYTLFVPDRARTAFPLFDQPDIKASYELTLVVPAGWKAMSSAPAVAVSAVNGRIEYRFAVSDLISSYLFSFVAGEFEEITREINGRSVTLLHRETNAEKLARNIDQIFDLHEASVAWMEDYTGIAFPFKKLGMVLIPSFQYGGMEHVGAIQYRASHLLLDEAPSTTSLLARAQLIAHETAHMWFGNLVTMRWFDDVWTKEVFANFMAGKIVNPNFEDINHDLNFLVDHYPQAYAVDRSEGPNPIRQKLPNLNEAGQMYGPIIYHKAPIMMRQLEQILGEASLRQGLREYLQTFSHANATWPDLIRILDARTDIDLAAWSRVWVNSPGRPEFGVIQSQPGAPLLRQYDPAGKSRLWPQSFSALALAANQRTIEQLQSEGRDLQLPPVFADADVRLYNSDGYGYGLFPATKAVVLVWQALTAVEKGSVLINNYENLLDGSLQDPGQYFSTLLEIVQVEPDQLLIELALAQLRFLYDCLLSRDQQSQQTPAFEEVLWQGALAGDDKSMTKLFFKSFAALASSQAAVAKVYGVWSGDVSIELLSLEEDELIGLAEILAIRLPAQAETIIERQLTRTGNPDRRRRLNFVAPSLAADPLVRDAFFESLGDVSNRQTETWVVDALRNLHHPTRLGHSEKYLLPSLELLQEVQVTGDIFFPSAWLQASLRNYRSTNAVETVRSFLAQRPNYSAQLRMKILQAADPMFRANRINPD